ncbi:arginine:ornithine antiporter [Enterovibrio norvegicus FF-33]|uniref:basic amino acid/polyamine antiporter n=1 Tax=Enterovibrio norvegicus TaxID=188144 RepID=UPI0003185465|nr:basic amino acid/polyamine antiporter [Enterovibrio norvegicus]OEE65978.1 arginine:ornithine antiporter [Enterovibrio norvegicus FF-33]
MGIILGKKLDLKALTALVIGSMIGAGVFSLPQNMAAIASPAAVTLGWAITGFGMVCLALTFQELIVNKPEVTGGVFGYAQAGFGDLCGFFSAWGYWLSAAVANVSYLVIVFSTLGLFFDTSSLTLFGNGNTLLSIGLSSILIWLVHTLVLRGVQTAAIVNYVTTIAKLIPIIIFIVAALIAFKWHTFTFDFSGRQIANEPSLFDQVKQTMLITVWVFIGVEGAVVVSSRAKNRKDVGRATILGLLTCLFLYVSVTLLAMGVVSTPELAKYPNPSTAKILEALIGKAGVVIIGAGLIISVCGAYLSWTLLATETPYSAAKEGMFPKCFAETNSNGAPTRSLWLTSSVVQLCLIFMYLIGGGYDDLLTIASEMILVPYLLVGSYLFKLSYSELSSTRVRIISTLATVYGVWLLYASGLHHLLLAALLYLPGIAFYIYAKREAGQPAFEGRNRILLALVIAAGLVAVYLLVKGVTL